MWRCAALGKMARGLAGVRAGSSRVYDIARVIDETRKAIAINALRSRRRMRRLADAKSTAVSAAWIGRHSCGCRTASSPAVYRLSPLAGAPGRHCRKVQITKVLRARLGGGALWGIVNVARVGVTASSRDYGSPRRGAALVLPRPVPMPLPKVVCFPQMLPGVCHQTTSSVTQPRRSISYSIPSLGGRE